MRQEVSFFDTTKTGDITNRLSSDCKTMVDTLSLNINVFLRCGVKVQVQLQTLLWFIQNESWPFLLRKFIRTIKVYWLYNFYDSAKLESKVGFQTHVFNQSSDWLRTWRGQKTIPSMLTVIGLPFGFFLGKVYGILFRNLQKKIQDALADANSLADETISSVKTVRSFANE